MSSDAKTPSPSEKTRLLAPSSGEQKNFYFAPRRTRTNSTEDNDALKRQPSKNSPHGASPSTKWSDQYQSANKSFFQKIKSSIFGSGGGGSSGSYARLDRDVASKPRKVPVKVEPKVFFANERTFLAWLHMSVTLASISVAIVAFSESNDWSQIYGLLLMPVAIMFSAYSLYMYMNRASLIRRKEAGPYEDKIGPIFLASMLALSISVNFLVKLYDMATR
jgi:uncharacterized membrane protein YidH (DUF202 family)